MPLCNLSKPLNKKTNLMDLPERATLTHVYSNWLCHIYVIIHHVLYILLVIASLHLRKLDFQ